MESRLTVRVDKSLAERAKAEARRRGKSVSRFVAECLEQSDPNARKTKKEKAAAARKLKGFLGGGKIGEEDYLRHLLEKYR
jgi:hypothetical protein